MSNSARHCPFLNQEDPRCSQRMQIGSLAQAFDYCMGSYSACAMYQQQLHERTEMREGRPEVRGEYRVEVTIAGRIARADRFPAHRPLIACAS